MEEQPRREISPKEVFNRALYSYIRDLTTPDPTAERVSLPVEHPDSDYSIQTRNKYGQVLLINPAFQSTMLKEDLNLLNGIVSVDLFADEGGEGLVGQPIMEVDVFFDEVHPNNITKIVEGDETVYMSRYMVSLDIDPIYNVEIKYDGVEREEAFIDEHLSDEEKLPLLKIEGLDAVERYKRSVNDPTSWHETIMFALERLHQSNPQVPSFTDYLQKTHQELSQPQSPTE